MAKAKTSKPRQPRTKANVPGGAAAGKAPGKGHNSSGVELTAAQMRDLFLGHRGKIIGAQAKVDAEQSKLDDLYATARADGFTKKDFDIAKDLATTRGESKIKGDLERRLTVAGYMGHDLANQLDLFVHGKAAAAPPQKSVDRAYDEGQMASAEGRAAKPDAAPGTPEYDAYMRGFHDHGTARLAGMEKPAGNA